MKLLRYVLLLAGLLAGGLPSAFAQVFEWAKLARNLNENRYATPAFSQGATTDLQGNTYVSVRFRDSVRVGGQRITATGPADVLVKYDATGQVAWTKVMRGVAFEQGGLKVNPATGDLFMTGRLFPNASWDGVPIAGAGQNTYFFGKCSPTGTLLWANLRPYLNLVSFEADDQGHCYLLGRSKVTTTVGGISVDSTTVTLVQAGGSTGVVQWQRKLRGTSPVGANGPTGLSIFHGLSARPGGGVLVFGQFTTSLYFNTGTTPVQTGTPQVLTDFIASVDDTGTLQWSRPTPGMVTAAAADATGNYYVTGFFPLPGTSASGIGVAKYSAGGTAQWTRTQTPVTGASGTSFETGRMVAVDGEGNVTIVADGNPWGGHGGSITRLGSLLLRSYANVVRFDAQGQELWVANDWANTSLNASRTAYVDAVNVGLDANGNAYYTTEVSGDTINPRPAVQYGAFTVVGVGVGVTRIGSQHNMITGRVYFDQNGNGQRDAGEGNFPLPLALEATQPNFSGVATATADGTYHLASALGAYSLSLPQPPANFVVSQPANGSYTGSFATYGHVDSTRHFGVRPIVNQTDLRATLTPYGAARPGFTTRYRLTIENVGTTTIPAGTATVTLDARLQYVGSTPAATISGRVVSWNYPALPLFGRRELDITFSLPVNTPLGTALATTAAVPVANDQNVADNSATTAQTVTGSFDPNDIDVNYQRLTPAQVAARLPLDYTIRFQNMGTDTAFTVVVSDTLDFRKLNIASLMLVSQSHNCIWSLSNAGLLTVRFPNINLPHRNQDVIRSMGFVRFRVQPRPTLTVGEVIPNYAGIVFDYNAPVITNTATTTVFVVTAALARHDNPAWETYPNPATDVLNVSANLAAAGPVRLELFDALGRSVRQQTLVAPAGPLRQILDLSTLGRGLYVLRLTPPTGPALSRQVVRE